MYDFSTWHRRVGIGAEKWDAIERAGITDPDVIPFSVADMEWETAPEIQQELAEKALYGCYGYNLDVLARGPIWDLDLDYQCGTGHGVGYLGNVHEAPTGFRWYVVPSKNEHHQLEEGMVITDEPGIYEDGKFGIRIENEFIVKKGVQNKYGQFMHFETVTFAPIDLDGIDPEEMSRDEKEWLNQYHKDVYKKIGPHLTEEEREWLKEYTREI